MDCSERLGARVSRLGRGLLFLLGMLLGLSAQADLHPIADEELSVYSGQALLMADQIAASSIPGFGTGSVDNNNGLSNVVFYRMGLNAQLDFNANINRFQLGCGGINDYINTGCDIDLSYVRFMGLNASDHTQPGDAVTSDFSLKNPYIELAINNDGSTNREVVGIKIGAESASGYLGVGRTYDSGQTNQETGQVCQGGNDINCHSGLKSFSGLLNYSVQGTVGGNLTYQYWVPIFVDGCGSLAGCLRTGSAGTYSAQLNRSNLQLSGTRIGTFQQQFNNLPTTINCVVCLGGFGVTVNALLTESLSYIHGLAINNTSDFFLSFQRQQLDYPTYDKSGFAGTANTGWWMNLPNNVALSGLNGSKDLDIGTALGGLFGVTIPITNINLGSSQTPPQNCYGSAKFC